MNKSAHIAELNQRLLLQRPLDAPDPIGGFAQQWETLAEVWAAVETTGAHLRFEAARREVLATHRITIRWRPDITGAMRFVGGSSVYSIVSANDGDGARAFLRCYCEEVQA